MIEDLFNLSRSIRCWFSSMERSSSTII